MLAESTKGTKQHKLMRINWKLKIKFMLPDKLLYQELSQKIEEIATAVRRQYGSGQKEKLYQNAFEDELRYFKVLYRREHPIVVRSVRTGRTLGKYVPDFIVDDKIVVELKAIKFIPKPIEDQLLNYLKNSNYELGYVINFGGNKLYQRRFIFTNDRKDRGLQKSTE